MVVGNKSDGGQTQESDGGNTICTSSSEEKLCFSENFMRKKGYEKNTTKF